MFMTLNQFGVGAPGMMPGGGPVRLKKKPGLFQSTVGVFIGILLILGSPVVMWQAGGQHRADDFDGATPIGNVRGGATTYAVIRQVNPTYVDPAAGGACHADGCIYEKQRAERLVTTRELECGTVMESESVRILYQDGYEYDEDTGETTPCYQVERDEWQEDRTEVLLYNVKMMAPFPEGVDVTTADPLPITLLPSEDAIYLDTQVDIIVDEKDANDKATHRIVYTSFVMPDTLLVAGLYNMEAAEFSAEPEKAYVWSAYDE
ncbi:MAG: hypothetical protein AAB898_01040, partial [Patescibacteria group bacterium]